MMISTLESWILKPLSFKTTKATQLKSHHPPLSQNCDVQLLKLPNLSNQFFVPLEAWKIYCISLVNTMELLTYLKHLLHIPLLVVVPSLLCQTWQLKPFSWIWWSSGCSWHFLVARRLKAKIKFCQHINNTAVNEGASFGLIWITITWIMVYQRKWWIHSGHRFIGSFD